MIKIRPSQAAFQDGQLVFTRYSSGCHRHIYLANYGIREEIDQKHKERGQLNEDWFERRLGSTPYAREKSFALTLFADIGVVLSGRCDYILFPTDPDKKEVVELKSSESPSILNDVIKKGKYKLENLAQLLCYLMAESCTSGRLIYAHYKKDKKTKEYYLNAEREFSVQVEDSGRILVDGEEAEFKVDNLLQHLRAAAVYLKNDQLAATRPYNESKFNGPCAYCVFKSSCELLDEGILTSVEEFVSQAKMDLLRKKERQENESTKV